MTLGNIDTYDRATLTNDVTIMRSDWFSPKKLAIRLAKNDVQNREVAYLILGSFLLSAISFYGAFTWANPPWTLLSLFEFVIVVFVILIGFTKCYDSAGGDSNDHFIKQFSCLSFGVWFWTTLIIWSVYWFVFWIFRQGVFAAFRFDQLGVANNLIAIGGSFGWAWTLIASVMWEVLFFAWMCRALKQANN